MADDQNKPFDPASFDKTQDKQGKASTIDDLVKELSKTSSNQPPSNLPGIKISDKPSSAPTPQPVQPRPFVPPAPAPQSKPSVPPSMAMPPRPAAPIPSTPKPPMPAAPTPSSGLIKPSSAQEYKSSIRTMTDDLASIKSGQKPAGVDVPRKITPELPRTQVPLPPSSGQPQTPAGINQQVGLGRAEKTGPLPTAPGIQSNPKASGLPKVPTIQPSINVPAEKKSLNLKFYGVVVGVLLVAGFLYWFMILRSTSPEIVFSPTSSIPTTPAAKSLDDLFGGVAVNFEVSLSDHISNDFKTFIGTLSVANKAFQKVSLVEKNENEELLPLKLMDMLDMDLIPYPDGLKNLLIDSIILAYGQSEKFNKDGSISIDANTTEKPVFVAKVRDITTVGTMMRSWESMIAEDLADYLLIDNATKKANQDFSDNLYREISIRYNNYIFPDTSVDYAVFEKNGQGYLVIGASREATYSTLDVLLNQ